MWACKLELCCTSGCVLGDSATNSCSPRPISDSAVHLKVKYYFFSWCLPLVCFFCSEISRTTYSLCTTLIFLVCLYCADLSEVFCGIQCSCTILSPVQGHSSSCPTTINIRVFGSAQSKEVWIIYSPLGQEWNVSLCVPVCLMLGDWTHKVLNTHML